MMLYCLIIVESLYYLDVLCLCIKKDFIFVSIFGKKRVNGKC